jgi:hypothetical protein
MHQAQPAPRRSVPAAEAPAVESFELTILIPCLNEAATIAARVSDARGCLERSGVSGEVLVADNGSIDGSHALAARAGARVVLAMERGRAAALQAGVAEARGRYIILGGDGGAWDAERLDLMLAALRDGAGRVEGDRFGGLRGFSREAIDGLALQDPGTPFASQVPAPLQPDDGDRPLDLRLLHDGARRLFLYPGLTLVAVGLFGAAMLLGGPVELTSSVRLGGPALVAACFSLLLGAQLVLFQALARRHGSVEGLLPARQASRDFLLGAGVETILCAAAVLLLAGLGGVCWAFSLSIGAGGAPGAGAAALRLLTVSLTGAALGLQLGSAGLLASILTLRRAA